MIIIETIRDNSQVHIFSDLGLQIMCIETDRICNDTIDINPTPYTYIETDYLIGEKIPETGPFKPKPEDVLPEEDTLQEENILPEEESENIE